jgi:hypothetical protein
MVVCRIGLGAIVYFAYLLFFPHFEAMYGAEGFYRYSYEYAEPNFLMANSRLFYAITLISGLTLALGLFTRTSGTVALVMHATWRAIGIQHGWGWAATIIPILAYVVLAPSGARYSLDALIRKRRGLSPASDKMTAWPMRILLVHIACVYLAAAWHRFDDPAWTDGQAVYVALTNSVFSRFPGADFHEWKSVMWVACWLAWTLELAAPLLLFIPRVRVPVAIGLIGMHVGLELTSCVGWWQILMSVVLITVLPAAWSERMLAWFARQFRRKRARPPDPKGSG